MAVRNYSGSGQWILCAIGTLQGIQNGACTIVAVAKTTAGSNSWRPLIGFYVGTNTGSGRSFWRSGSTNRLHSDTNGSDYFAGVNFVSADGWATIGWSKAAGSAVLRGHKRLLPSGGWTHTNGDTMPDVASTIDNLKIGRWSTSGDTWHGRTAVIGVWKSNLSDGQIESCTSLSAMLALSPHALIETGTNVTDITGNGANLVTNNGTTVVTDDDPPGFSLSLTGPIDLGAATATATAVALDPLPGPVTVELAPAVATFAGEPVTPEPGSTPVDLDPSSATATAVPLVPVPGMVSVSLEPAVLPAVGVAVDPEPGMVSVSLDPALVTAELSPMSFPGAANLAPAIGTIEPVPLDPLPGIVSVPLQPAIASVVGVSVNILGAPAVDITVLVGPSRHGTAIVLPSRAGSVTVRDGRSGTAVVGSSRAGTVEVGETRGDRSGS